LRFCAAEAEVERAAPLLVLPDVAVDGLVADPERAGQGEPSGDLLGAPELVEQGFDQVPVLAHEPAVAPGPGSAAAGVAVGGAGAVAPVLAGVALDLPADGARVAVEGAGDLGLAVALFSERGEFISLT
jgi:hypothetical protein